jgi:hypothetical protein
MNMENLIYIINAGAWLNYCSANLGTTVSSHGLNVAGRLAIAISIISVLIIKFI